MSEAEALVYTLAALALIEMGYSTQSLVVETVEPEAQE